jgi:hypothetical protein
VRVPASALERVLDAFAIKARVIAAGRIADDDVFVVTLATTTSSRCSRVDSLAGEIALRTKVVAVDVALVDIETAEITLRHASKIKHIGRAKRCA